MKLEGKIVDLGVKAKHSGEEDFLGLVLKVTSRDPSADTVKALTELIDEPLVIEMEPLQSTLGFQYGTGEK